MADIVTTCVIAFFLLILLAGFIFGLVRGFNKSLTRIFMVIAALVISFFVAPKVTTTLMTVDISGLGVTIAGESAANVGDIFTILLKEIPAVQDIAGTDAFVKIMDVVPQLILNVIVFILLFYILRLITMIAYWIISGICFNKKKTEGKNPHRLIGSVIGLVQNFVIFLALLVPIVGFTNVLGDIETTTQNYTPATEAVATAHTTGEAPDENPENPENTDNAVTPYQTVTEVITEYKNSWVAKFVSGVKLDQACMHVFNNLSTLEYNGVEYNLREEANNVTIIYLDLDTLLDLGEFDLGNPNTILCLQALINDCYNSDLTADLIDEVAKEAAKKWIAGETFCGLSRPTISGFDGVVDSILEKIKDSPSVQSALISMTNIVESIMSTVDNIYVDGNVNVDELTELLNGLTKPETLEFAHDIISSNIDNIISNILPEIEEGSKEETIANVVTEIVDSIFSEEAVSGEHNIGNEVAVVGEALKVAQTLGNGEELSQDSANDLIEALNNSTIILDTLSSVTQDSEIKDYVQKAIDYADETAAAGEIKASEKLLLAINELDAADERKALLLDILGLELPQA